MMPEIIKRIEYERKGKAPYIIDIWSDGQVNIDPFSGEGIILDEQESLKLLEALKLLEKK
jgi:hypothetical protein